ncbi:MAG: NAD(+) diphosphatase [Eubacteriales bacterium]|nr:NAD(+) diphosphatase [Eubacteriales bacterium]
MIQDIKPKKFRNEYQHVKAGKSDFCLVYRGGKVLIKVTEGQIFYPTFEEIHADPDKGIYAFRIDQTKIFLYPEEITGCTDDYTYYPMNFLRQARPKDMAYAGVVGCHLDTWYRDNVFCGRCTARLEHDTKERMLYCPECGNRIYPKICPAVIVCVTHKDKALITKYAGRAYTRYALIAGFTEIGETAEETVAREVMEEVGIKVKNIEYYKSQPWGFSGGLLMGFFCEADGDTALTIDTHELSVGKWVDIETLKDMDDGVSLTREMMRVAYERRNAGRA